MKGIPALQEWLEETGTTQVQLAREIQVSQPTISDWVNGNITPSVDNLVRLSGVTGISIERLVREAAAA